MEAVILAGGFGTRLQSVVSDVPKPMAPIGERPFLEILLDHLLNFKFDHIILSTGYMHEKIESHFGDNYRGVTLSYAVEETPLGTGGGMRNALSFCNQDNIVVLNGDTLFKVDYDALKNFHDAHRTRLTMVMRRVDDTSRYGSVSVDSEGHIINFAEKETATGSGYINGGIYLLQRSLLEEFELGMSFSFEKELLQKLYKMEYFYAYPSSAYFIDIGIPDDYHRLCSESGDGTLNIF